MAILELPIVSYVCPMLCQVERQSFPNWLQAQLDKRKITPSELAAAAGVEPSTITRILNEERGVGKRVAKKIAKGLKLDAELVLFKAGITDRDPESPKEGLDPIALEILQMLENRSDAQKQAVKATVQALVDGFDRGLDGRVGSGNSGTLTRSKQDRA